MSVSARHRRVERGGLEIESRGGFDVISINPFSLRQVKPRSEKGEQKALGGGVYENPSSGCGLVGVAGGGWGR